jgi:uncharacterized protein (TIGR00159 family)
MASVKLFEWVWDIGISGFLDILLLALLIYAVLVWLKRRKVTFVLFGLIIIAGLYLLTLQFNLILTSKVFEKFFAVIFIALVIIFQAEIKDLFEEVAVWSLNRRFIRRRPTSMAREEAEVLVRTLSDLSREKIGALVILKGREAIARHLEGGIDLNGQMSEALLKSIFDTHSAGHDGALIIENGSLVSQFGCHLPLSKNFERIGKHGTRHAAALGLSELTDALCLVVSEERGTISAARFGEMHDVSDPQRMSEKIGQFYDEIQPQQKVRPLQDFTKRNFREKTIAVLLALGVWFELVYGSELTYTTFSVPVHYIPLPPKWSVTAIEPHEVELTFRGPRNAFYFLNREKIKVVLGLKLQPGKQGVKISSAQLKFPENLELESVEPREIRFIVKSNGETKAAEAAK